MLIQLQLQPTPPAVPDPQTAELVAQTIYGAMIFGAIALIWLYLSQPDQDGGVSRWRRWRAAAEDWLASGVSLRRYLAGERGVNDFEDGDGMEEEQTTPDRQTDEPDRRADAALSGDLERKPRLAVDRTRQALMEELLTLGWTVTEFRKEGVFRGDNTTISTEVEEARQRAGLESPAAYRTPIAGREVKRDLFYPDEPDLEYRTP